MSELSFTHSPSEDKITYFVGDEKVGEVASRHLVELGLNPLQYGKLYIKEWKEAGDA